MDNVISTRNIQTLEYELMRQDQRKAKMIKIPIVNEHKESNVEINDSNPKIPLKSQIGTRMA